MATNCTCMYLLSVCYNRKINNNGSSNNNNNNNNNRTHCFEVRDFDVPLSVTGCSEECTVLILF